MSQQTAPRQAETGSVGANRSQQAEREVTPRRIKLKPREVIDHPERPVAHKKRTNGRSEAHSTSLTRANRSDWSHDKSVSTTISFKHSKKQSTETNYFFALKLLGFAATTTRHYLDTLGSPPLSPG
jgi:hypothetical protein